MDEDRARRAALRRVRRDTLRAAYVARTGRSAPPRLNNYLWAVGELWRTLAYVLGIALVVLVIVLSDRLSLPISGTSVLVVILVAIVTSVALLIRGLSRIGPL